MSKDIHERGYIYNFHFHLVFVTKYRNNIFNSYNEVQDMKDILKEIAKNNEVSIENIEVMPNHVHMLISFKPKKTPSSLVKAFKGVSARRFFQKYPDVKKSKMWGGHLWSNSYYMSTLGNMSKDVVEKYIKNQKD